MEETKLTDMKDNAQKYYVSYKRHSTAVALMWGIFTCGYVVLNVVAFVQPEWLQQTDDPLMTPGYFGLYRKCRLMDQGKNLSCVGHFNDFSSIDNAAFRASTFFVGVSCLIVFLCICLFSLFFLIKHSIVYVVCGILQFVSGLFMFLGCIIYPAGWKSLEVQNMCGFTAESFVIGNCKVGWAYILAMVGIFDALFLAILALILATRQENWTDNDFAFGSSRSDMNGFIEDNSSSKPSMFISPELSGPDRDSLSEFSHSTKRSKRSNFAL